MLMAIGLVKLAQKITRFTSATAILRRSIGRVGKRSTTKLTEWCMAVAPPVEVWAKYKSVLLIRGIAAFAMAQGMPNNSARRSTDGAVRNVLQSTMKGKQNVLVLSIRILHG